MSLIDQQKDLESFSDESLLQEATQPMRGYPPYLVMAEIQRRQQDRSRVQQQSMAQQPEAPPVAMQQVAEFANQMAPQGQAQPGMGVMPQAPGMGMAQPQMAPEAAPAPVGIMGGAPIQGMAGGGEVKRMQAGRDVPNDPLYRLGSLMTRIPSMVTPRRAAFSLKREIDQIEAAGGDASALRAELEKITRRSMAPEVGAGPQATPSSAPGIASVAAPSRTDIQGALNAPTGSYLRGVPTGIASTDRTAQAVDARQVARPPAPGIEQLQDVAVTGKRTDPYYLEAASEMYKFAPKREDFERMSRAETMVGLGEIIGGATQRGDIAKGLAALTRQRLAGEREMRKEERDFQMGLLGLKGQERAETRAETREAAAIARDEARFKIEIALKSRELDMRRDALREETAARMKAANNDAERLEIQRKAAELEERIFDDKQDLLRAQAEYYRGKGGSQFPFGGQGNFASAGDIASALGQ